MAKFGKNAKRKAQFFKRYPLLRLHAVAISFSYRITLELLIQDRQIIQVNVGDHDAVY